MTDRRKRYIHNGSGLFICGLVAVFLLVWAAFVLGFLLAWGFDELTTKAPEPISTTYSSANHQCVKGPDGMCERWEL